jgi:hypothetical protein
VNQGKPQIRSAGRSGQPAERIDVPEDWSPVEARALSLWTAAEPTAGFEQRLLARAGRERAAALPPLRLVAVAAVALLLAGGAVSVRTLMGRPGPAFERQPAAGFATQDAGPRPEVRAPFDGIEAQPS